VATEYFREHANDMTTKGSERRSLEFAVNSFITGYDDEARNNPEELSARIVKDLKLAGGGYLLANVVARLIERGDKLPGPFKDFVISFLRDPAEWKSKKEPGRKPWALLIRNLHIGAAILAVCKHCDIPATRNRAKKGVCGASIAKDALAEGAGIHLSEADVVKAWDYFRRHMSNGSGLLVLGDVVIATNDWLERRSSEELEPNK
jgi:hypothetical protein